MWQNVVSSVISGVIMLFVGILIGEPLKKWISGQRKAEKKQKIKMSEKKKIINYLAEQTSLPDTEDIQKALFTEKTIDDVYELLLELEEEGRVGRQETLSQSGKHAMWMFFK